MEPETPWKYKPKILHEKNQHGVDFAKIKKTLDDFDKKIDLEKLVNECRNEINPAPASVKTTPKPKPKPSGLFGNVNGFLGSNIDWSSMQETNFTKNAENKNTPDLAVLEVNEKVLNDLTEPNTSLFDRGYNQDSMTKSFDHLDDQYEIDHSRELLQQMFPNVNEEILLDFLLKYQNDVDTVTNILLDSVNLSETNEMAPSSAAKKSEPKCIDSLKNLCTRVLDKLEIELEKHYEKEKHNAQKVLNDSNTSSDQSYFSVSNSLNDSKEARGDETTEKVVESLEKKRQLANSLIKQQTKFDVNFNRKSAKTNENKSKSHDSLVAQNDFEEDHKKEDDSLLTIKLPMSSLSALIQLFGTEEEENFVNGKKFSVKKKRTKKRRIWIFYKIVY